MRRNVRAIIPNRHFNINREGVSWGEVRKKKIPISFAGTAWLFCGPPAYGRNGPPQGRADRSRKTGAGLPSVTLPDATLDVRAGLGLIPISRGEYWRRKAPEAVAAGICGDTGSPARNFAPPAGFELVDGTDRERGGLPTMPGGRKPVLPVTVFTDYI